MRAAITLGFILCVAGCASYQFDLVRPPAFAQHIGNTPTNVPLDPLIYQLQSLENRLIMLIRNPTNDAITLLPDRSVIIDPDGRSHPVLAQTIAPSSYIELIFPPPFPVEEYDDYGPDWVGAGGGGYWHYRHHGYYRPGYYYGFYGGPEYVTVYDPNDPTYFEWNGETDLRMTLSFDRNGKRFDHSFVFHRRKVK
jgi:hypothetical protein